MTGQLGSGNFFMNRFRNQVSLITTASHVSTAAVEHDSPKLMEDGISQAPWGIKRLNNRRPAGFLI